MSSDDACSQRSRRSGAGAGRGCRWRGRVAEDAAPQAAAPFVYDEQEPAGSNGSNDSQVNAEPISGFGTGRRENPRVRILGSIADLIPESTPIETREDDGAIPLANETGIDGEGAVTADAVLGDAHGGPTGTNDFDFYALSSRQGLTITVDTTRTAVVDTVVAIYNADGELLAVNDDAFIPPNFLGGRLVFPVPAEGDYYVMVAGWSPEGSLPEDPNDPSSGAGGADQGDYTVSIVSGRVDTDYFALRLDKGDVLGAVGRGVADTLTIWRPDGTKMVGAPRVDASFLYPPESPLPGGGEGGGGATEPG